MADHHDLRCAECAFVAGSSGELRLHSFVDHDPGPTASSAPSVRSTHDGPERSLPRFLFDTVALNGTLVGTLVLVSYLLAVGIEL